MSGCEICDRSGETRLRGVVPVTLVGCIPGTKLAMIDEPWAASFPSHGSAIRRSTITLDQFDTYSPQETSK